MDPSYANVNANPEFCPPHSIDEAVRHIIANLNKHGLDDHPHLDLDGIMYMLVYCASDVYGLVRDAMKNSGPYQERVMQQLLRNLDCFDLLDCPILSRLKDEKGGTLLHYAVIESRRYSGPVAAAIKNCIDPLLRFMEEEFEEKVYDLFWAGMDDDEDEDGKRIAYEYAEHEEVQEALVRWLCRHEECIENREASLKRAARLKMTRLCGQIWEWTLREELQSEPWMSGLSAGERANVMEVMQALAPQTNHTMKPIIQSTKTKQMERDVPPSIDALLTTSSPIHGDKCDKDEDVTIARKECGSGTVLTKRRYSQRTMIPCRCVIQHDRLCIRPEDFHEVYGLSLHGCDPRTIDLAESDWLSVFNEIHKRGKVKAKTIKKEFSQELAELHQKVYQQHIQNGEISQTFARGFALERCQSAVMAADKSAFQVAWANEAATSMSNEAVLERKKMKFKFCPRCGTGKRPHNII